MADSVTQQIVSESPEVEAYKLKLLEQAQKLAFNTGAEQTLAQQLPSYEIAGFTAPQMAAMEAATQAGIGSYMPYMTAANQALGSAYGTTAEAADIMRAADTRNQFYDAQQAMQQAGQATGNITAGIGQLGQGAGYLDLAAQRAALSDTSGQFGQARQLMSPAVGAVQTGLTGGMLGLAGAAGRYNPADVTAFTNPYQQLVIDEAMRQINRQGDIARQGLAAQAVRSGAFGGTREGVQRAELERGLTEQKANMVANLLSQGYTQAQANAMASFEQQQGRQMQAAQGIGQLGMQAGQQFGNIASQQGALAGQEAAINQNIANLLMQQAGARGQLAQTAAGIYGQQGQQLQNIGMGIGQLASQQFGIGQQQAQGLGALGGQLGQLGVQQGALGQTAQALQQGDINFLYNVGQSQQALNQQTIDAARANELQKIYAPYQQAAFLSDIYKGAPSTQMSTQASSQAQASPFQQALGIGLGATATLAGAKKAGLF